eukprot:TRINITY_DN13162_c0_g1_i1.p1 TRINITY_DN13162_c0_g1~~TRINITY_DN13162_c0_g1_i1.p1  ORF type:complete len:580 (+),score=148.64 TRINITY_DN13162_c0_g1_i1:1-1740(+)
MDSKNMGIVLGPNLIRLDSTILMKATASVNEAISLMIEKYPSVFDDEDSCETSDFEMTEIEVSDEDPPFQLYESIDDLKEIQLIMERKMSHIDLGYDTSTPLSQPPRTPLPPLPPHDPTPAPLPEYVPNQADPDSISHDLDDEIHANSSDDDMNAQTEELDASSPNEDDIDTDYETDNENDENEIDNENETDVRLTKAISLELNFVKMSEICHLTENPSSAYENCLKLYALYKRLYNFSSLVQREKIEEIKTEFGQLGNCIRTALVTLTELSGQLPPDLSSRTYVLITNFKSSTQRLVKNYKLIGSGDFSFDALNEDLEEFIGTVFTIFIETHRTTLGDTISLTYTELIDFIGYSISHNEYDSDMVKTIQLCASKFTLMLRGVSIEVNDDIPELIEQIENIEKLSDDLQPSQDSVVAFKETLHYIIIYFRDEVDPVLSKYHLKSNSNIKEYILQNLKSDWIDENFGEAVSSIINCSSDSSTLLEKTDTLYTFITNMRRKLIPFGKALQNKFVRMMLTRYTNSLYYYATYLQMSILQLKGGFCIENYENWNIISAMNELTNLLLSFNTFKDHLKETLQKS